MSPVFDEVWENRYREDPNYRNHYPWTEVVSFLLQSFPTLEARNKSRVLEIGCGNGSNLWFAAREGFNVVGLDASATAVNHARNWFKIEGLSGEFHTGSFTNLPLGSDEFDVVVDRGAVTVTNYQGMLAALDEAHRVLKAGGLMFFTPYGDQSSSFYEPPDENGVVSDIKRGPVSGLGGQVLFMSFKDILIVTKDKWLIKSAKLILTTDFVAATREQDARWEVILEKK